MPDDLNLFVKLLSNNLNLFVKLSPDDLNLFVKLLSNDLNLFVKLSPDDLNFFVEAVLDLVLDQVNIQPGLPVQLAVCGQSQGSLTLVQSMLQLFYLLLARNQG